MSVNPARRPATSVATIAFVAAGPGDPELVTMRAVTVLGAADLILVDADAKAVADRYAGANAEIIVAVDDDGLPLAQAARAKMVVDAAKAGRNAVRVLAGDPVFDGSIAAEAAVVSKAKLTFEIVPGVSPVTGVPAYAGIPLMGGDAREVHVLNADNIVEWDRHVDPAATLVIINGADKSGQVAAQLIAAGRDPNTPVSVTRGGTTVEQRTLMTTLAQLPALAKTARQAGPGIIVVGAPVAQRDKLSWFETKPLFGWRVLVPRTKEQAGALSQQLIRYGAIPVEVPTISVEPPRTPQQMERVMHGLVSGRYHWVVFTSTNAVKAIRERFEEYGLDARAFAGLHVAAVGEQTAAALEAFGVRPDLVPSEDQSSVGLLADFPAFDEDIDPLNRVLLPRADIATETLVEGLTTLGWEVEDVTAYRTVRAAPPPAETREAIKTGGFDAVMFTSSSTVRNLVGIAGKPHASTVVAVIGPQTAQTAEEHGLRVDVRSNTPSAAALAEALAEFGAEMRQASLDAGETFWRPSQRKGMRKRA